MLTQKRWAILAASCVANLCIGAVYAWSVFAGPMAGHLNSIHGTALTAADLAFIFSFSTSVEFITSIAGGYCSRRFGADWVVRIGVIVFGLGFVVCGFAANTAVLAVGFGLMCGLSGGFAYMGSISNCVKFFPDKKGLAGGLSTASYGISSVIIPPIAHMLNETFGVSRAFLIFGAVILAAGALSSLVIKNCPDDFVPEGWNPLEGKSAGSSVKDKNAIEMLKTPIFYVMFCMLVIGASLGLMVISSASDIAETMIGMNASAAALMVSILALFNTGGRILCGGLSDKIGRINTLAGVYAAAIVALLAMYASGGNGSAAMFAAGICLIGFCYGAFMGIYPGFTSDQFGTKNSSLNYGIMFSAFSVAGFLGPMVMRMAYNGQGSYRPAFLIAVGIAATGLAVSFLYRAMARKT
ncbi:MAG: OFA family MFS transporter [Eubacteriales bacterium]|nr:OFA family MFS transporter [Eubacteriales bacterium]